MEEWFLSGLYDSIAEILKVSRKYEIKVARPLVPYYYLKF